MNNNPFVLMMIVAIYIVLLMIHWQVKDMNKDIHEIRTVLCTKEMEK